MSIDKLKPTVPVTLGGQVYALRYSYLAFVAIEEERGANFLSTCEKLTVGKMFFLLWAGLIDNHPEFDGASPEARRAGQRKVIELAGDDADIAELSDAVTRAITKASVYALKEKKIVEEAKKATEEQTG